MRILYVASARNFNSPGGIETYGRELMKGIAGRGHSVECLETTPDLIAADRRLADYWPAPAFRQRYYLRRRFPHEDYRFHMALRRRASRMTAAFRPDVIHALHSYPLGAVIDAHQPVVVTTHGLEIEPIPPVVGSLSVARVVHANSHFTAALVRRRIPGSSPVEVVGWGVRTPQPRDQTCEFDLITVARLVRRKNVDTVLRALRGLGELRYAVVGDGPELGALKELARSLGLSRVSFFGAVSEEERRALLARSRVFVMCPRQDPGDVEGLGLVYLEAFSPACQSWPRTVAECLTLSATPGSWSPTPSTRFRSRRRFERRSTSAVTASSTSASGPASERTGGSGFWTSSNLCTTGPRQARAGNLERVECVKQTTRHVTRSAGPIHSRSSSAIVRGDGALCASAVRAGPGWRASLSASPGTGSSELGPRGAGGVRLCHP